MLEVTWTILLIWFLIGDLALIPLSCLLKASHYHAE